MVGEDEVTEEARELVRMAPSVLRKLTPTELGEGAYILGQYSHRLQQAANRERTRVVLAEESIKRCIAKTVADYRGYSFEERKLQAVADNDAAMTWDKVRVHALLRLERVSYLSGKANDLAMTLMSLQKCKRETRD